MKDGYKEMLDGGKIVNSIHKNKNGIINTVWNKKEFPKSKFGMQYANQEISTIDYSEAKSLNGDYIPVNVKYVFDDNGYRKYESLSNKFDKSIYCFGCENTFGVGNKEEHTWPYILATLFSNVNVNNFGSVGHGNEAMIRTCYQVIRGLDKKDYPDSIYFMFPDFFRIEYYGNIGEKIIEKNIQPLLNWSSSEIFIENNFMDIDQLYSNENSKIYTHYIFTSAINSFFNFVENFKFLKEFLDSRKIKWYWYTWYKPMYELNEKELLTFLKENTILDKDGLKFIPQYKNMISNDNLHFGYEYNKILANEFYKLRKTDSV